MVAVLTRRCHRPHRVLTRPRGRVGTKRAAARPIPRTVPVPHTDARRVLLVEDDAAIREMTQDILSEDGFTVVPAPDAEVALSCLDAEGPFDLLVSDIGLPGMNGRDLARLVTERHPGMPVLLVTGYAGEAGARPDFLPTGMNLLKKPFTLKELLGSVHSVL